jgi:hypothetical protein
MAGSFEVASEALRGHAGAVERLADDLQRAFDSAAHVALTPDAYGQTCEPATAILNATAATAGLVLRSGIDALEQAAAALRDTATTYAEADAERANSLTAITGRLG